MMYFHAYAQAADGRQIVVIAVVEDARRAERYESQGYTRCTRAAFRAAWRLRDACTLTRLHTAVIAANQGRSSELADEQLGISRAFVLYDPSQQG